MRAISDKWVIIYMPYDIETRRVANEVMHTPCKSIMFI